MSQTPPVDHELIYSATDRGFALCSMRNACLSRYCIQGATSDIAADWTGDAFWGELKLRNPPEFADRLVTCPAIDTSSCRSDLS